MDARKAKSAAPAEPLRIVIAGGGTGGHLYPGLALADRFRELRPGSQIVFVGTARGLEARVVVSAGFELLLVPVRGLHRRLSWQNLQFPFRLAVSIFLCWRYMRRFRPHLVIGTGGYASGPALAAARLLGIRRVIQEQNSYPGLVNRRVGHRVDAVFLTFEASKKYFPKQKNLFVFGNPMRAELGNIPRPEAAAHFDLEPARKTLLIFGGSQGARKLNEIVGQALPELVQRMGVQVIWAVGPDEYASWQQSPLRQLPGVRIYPFIEAMEKAYSAADLAICRAGATTIAELATCGLPAVYVPFPHATADHQTANARAMAELGGGLMIPEAELTAGRLNDTVVSLLGDPLRLRQMAGAARRMSMGQAATKIVQQCLRLIEGES